MTVFGWDLASEPHFVDESAYISQSFFGDLWLEGRRDDPSWLTYAGYDLPPLPKYLIGASLRAGGYRRPAPQAMWEWYANTSRRFVSGEALTVARIPSVLLGALGALAIYALGTIAADRRVGLLAALLLIANPLYQMHARRAMSDVPAEALILSTAAVGLWAWKRLLAARGTLGPSMALAIGSGVLCGLATLAKLNGVLGGFILAAWAALAMLEKKVSGTFNLVAPTGATKLKVPDTFFSGPAVVLATVMAGGVAFATFAALNPFLFAHPKGPIDPSLEPLARMSFRVRVKVISNHRVDVSLLAKSIFPDDALKTLPDKLKAVAV
jgi:hypothetical protein